ncbi:MAG TPA: hypothetical protein VKQ30_20815 [Ktedonobacterales bacterium]|nr:hypothetical protein [Ktedonobacterales bacterium]
MSEEFRTRIRRVTDKRTGNAVILHEFRKPRHESVRAFMRSAQSIAEINRDGTPAYFICSFDRQMMPAVCSHIDDDLPVTNAILVAAVTEAFRHRLIDYVAGGGESTEHNPCG